MKKIALYLVALCCLNFSSCSFLEEKSQDEVRPSTVDDLIQLMLGEGYILSDEFINYIDLLTDDVQSSCPNPEDYRNVDILDKYKSVYLWDPKMYEIAEEKKTPNYNHWEYLYHKIMGCNVVLSMIDEVIGEKESRENLRGQALAMRGFYYFMLVNIYSMPYTSGNPNDIMGVPIITEPQLKDSYPPRASLDAVYAQIISDLTDAYTLLNQYGKKNIVYRATDKFVNAILSRVYLYMGEWEKSIEFSNYIIDKYPSLQKLANHIESIPDPDWPDFYPPTIKPNLDYNVFGSNSDERLWAYSKSVSISSVYLTVFPGSAPAWHMSDDLTALYEDDPSGASDCRKDFYFVGYFSPSWTIEPLFQDKGMRVDRTPSQGIRTAEIYLNRAEANIMLTIEGKGGNVSQALSDINTLRESRFNTKDFTYTPWTTSDPQELLKMYRDERRRELAFENHRWFDLRRWGITNFSHTIEQIQGVKQTVVFNNPKMYALPIPEIVIERNPSIKRNLY